MGVKVNGAAGPLALGAKGSVRDRLTPPGRVEGFRPRELYSIAALARYGAFGAIFMPPLAAKTFTTALRAKKCIPLWCLTATPSPRKRWDYGCLAMEPCLRSRIRGSRAPANHQNANQAI